MLAYRSLGFFYGRELAEYAELLSLVVIEVAPELVAINDTHKPGCLINYG